MNEIFFGLWFFLNFIIAYITFIKFPGLPDVNSNIKAIQAQKQDKGHLFLPC